MNKLLAIVATAVAMLAGCSSMNRDTAIGAGVGAVGGNALSGGSTWGTLGGAAVGGAIGNRYSRDHP
jgi:osmotically inducible lipoprotein OsmB